MITVVGLGPSGISQISVGAYGVLRSAPTVFVRTARHPAVDDLIEEGVACESLDYIYESAGTFDEVYVGIAERILREAERGDIVYAVPGHPLVGETSVKVLLDEAHRKDVEVKVIGSESFIEASLEALGFGFNIGLKIVDALSLDKVSLAQDTGNLIYQVYDRSIASDVKLMLMEQYPDEFEITVVTGAGSPNQQVQIIPLHKLDRCECDHLTTVYIPAYVP